MGFEDLYVAEQDAWGVDERARRELAAGRKEEERSAHSVWVKSLSLSSLISHYTQINRRLSVSSEFEGVRQAERRGDIESALDYEKYSDLVHQASSLSAEIDRRTK